MLIEVRMEFGKATGKTNNPLHGLRLSPLLTVPQTPPRQQPATLTPSRQTPPSTPVMKPARVP
ncbi:hypothetical protein E2C01_048887 [Portunus trituberculatus]|uniref:Uncharacterized protein n=1 Tax=Portunus trituberculatus TaxID=210409 RepID=A0A5B7GCD2_PORTR|nr:hypothetical protein [Portunus trituberculatus]